MKEYSHFAPVYDFILKHIDYPGWFEFISDVMIQYCQDPKNILEIGCGTGKFGAKFSAAGYKITGMDLSLDMLKVAKTRTYNNFRTFCGNMQNFAISKKMDFIFSVHDTMNYNLSEDEFIKTLQSVKNTMHKDSIFMFDITTEYNIVKNFENSNSSYKTHGTKISWDNNYDKAENKIYSYLTFKDSKTGVESKEVHVQKIYKTTEIENMLIKTGFKILDVFGDHSFDPPQKKSVMINYIVGI